MKTAGLSNFWEVAYVLYYLFPELKEIIASAKERGSSMVEKRKVLPVSNKEQKYQRTRSGRLRSSSGRLVPEFFQGYDVSHIAQKSSQFLNLVFCILILTHDF